MTPSVKVFPFEAGTPAKITTDRVGRLVEALSAAGCGRALCASHFGPGKFALTLDAAHGYTVVITVDAAHGYTVSWLKIGGLREVAA